MSKKGNNSPKNLGKMLRGERSQNGLKKISVAGILSGKYHTPKGSITKATGHKGTLRR